jgi:hypothetical protein
MTVTINHTTSADDSFSAQGATAWNAAHAVSGLGTMAEQNANAVAITGGTISGTTVSGVVTAVSGTAPIASSGGTTPAISISQATTSTNGYLSSTDWNTFNNKLSTAVTSATAGTGMSVSASTGAVTFTNTAPDQTVVLTAGSNVTITGAYPSFTIASSGGGGGGDVVGPASATDNAVARYDSTTGKLLQNSVVTVGDTGAVAGVTTLAASTSVTTPIVRATDSGGLALKNSAGTTQISMGGGGGDNVTIAVPTNINGANAQIDISPTGTGHVHIKPTGTGSLEIAPTNVGTMDNMTIGGTTARAITGTTITATSFVGSGASLTNVVNSLAASTGISVSGSTGAVTVTNTAPDQTVSIASGTGISATGTYPSFTVTNTAPDQTVSIASGTGISASGTYPNFTVTNTAPDQTVAFTNGTGISVTGTYPNFTVTNTAPSSGGTVTSVTGTAPVVSSGGNTPAISMAAATGSVNGYLTSTDWNTFNSKGSGTVTSVAALTLGTTGTDLSSSVATGTTTPVITLNVPTASAANRGALSAADWTTFNNKGSGTVTSVGGTGSINGLTLTGTVTSSGNLTLGGSITSVSTSGNFQMNSLGVGTAGSTTAGEIRATNNVTAYYSSDRTLKENIANIDNALDIVCSIGSKSFDWTEKYIESKGGVDGYFVQKSDFGVIAQDVQAVFPQAVRTREDGTLAVDYEKLGTLAFGAISQLLKRVEALESK